MGENDQTWQFCFACETWHLLTEKEFRSRGHIGDDRHALERTYGVTPKQYEILKHKFDSGAFPKPQVS